MQHIQHLDTHRFRSCVSPNKVTPDRLDLARLMQAVSDELGSCIRSKEALLLLARDTAEVLMLASRSEIVDFIYMLQIYQSIPDYPQFARDDARNLPLLIGKSFKEFEEL